MNANVVKVFSRAFLSYANLRSHSHARRIGLLSGRHVPTYPRRRQAACRDSCRTRLEHRTKTYQARLDRQAHLKMPVGGTDMVVLRYGIDFEHD